jgi:hypothetical protein
MYTDKDGLGNISIMEMSHGEAQDLAALLFEFEHLLDTSSLLPCRERLRLEQQSVRIRQLIVNELR